MKGRGAGAGAVAGLVAVAAMYVAAALTGLKPLPELLQGPVLALMPGPVFGFLIDNLQHLGKVLEEAGLILTLVLAGALAGLVLARVAPRLGRWSGVLLAMALWLVLMLLVLPAVGDGLFGLAEGLTAPAVYALLAVIFVTVLELLLRPVSTSEADPERRRALSLLPVGLGLASLGVLGLKLLPQWYGSVVNPPEAGLSGPSPEITPVGNFYVVSKNFSDPVVSEANWRLKVEGLVRKPFSLSLAELRSRPATDEYVTFECISNDVGGPLISTGRFTGAPLRDLLRQAEPLDSARTVAYRARDGFTESYPLKLVTGAPEILVAYDLDGRPLPDKHGFPARIVLPGHYGMKQPKWLDTIELRSDDPGGFWEEQGWDASAPVKTNSRIDYPHDGFILKRQPVELSGVAFAGTRGVSSVEVSTDGGRTWNRAVPKPPLSRFTWTLWRYTWLPPHSGVFTVTVRATDGSGNRQDSRQAASFPSGASGYHSIQVSVA